MILSVLVRILVRTFVLKKIKPSLSMTCSGIIKTLAPKNQSIKIKTSDGVRYYKLSWRERGDNQGMPF